MIKITPPKPNVLLLSSSVILGLATLFYGYSSLIVLLALIPVFYFIETSHNISKRSFFLHMYLYGLILCGFSYGFILEVSLRNWEIPISPIIGYLVSLFSWTVVTLVGALAYGFIGYVLWNIPVRYRLLSLVPLWPIAEIIRSVLFSIVTYGHGGDIGANTNYGSLATLASATPVVYLARFFNFFGLVIIVVLVNYLVYSAIASRKKKEIAQLIIVSVLIISVGYLGWLQGNDNASKKVSVGVVHLKYDATMGSFDQLPGLMNNVDLLILPEYAYLHSHINYQEILSKVNKKGLILTSSREVIGSHGYNSLVAYDNSGKLVSVQRKRLLIPNGEYMPYPIELLLILSGKESFIREYDLQFRTDKGSEATEPIVFGDNLTVGGLACSGVLNTREYANLRGKGAGILSNSASLALLNQNSTYDSHGKSMARFHAVYNNRYFVQSSRSSESYIIDNQGNFVRYVNANENSYFEHPVLVK